MEFKEDATLDLIELDTALSPEKLAAVEALDDPTYDFFTPTGRTRTFDDQPYPIARVSLDLGHYHADSAYRTAFTNFAGRVRSHYDKLLAESGRSIDEVDNDLRNFYHFLSYPRIHFRIPLTEARAKYIRRFDDFSFYLRDTGTKVGDLHLMQVEVDQENNAASQTDKLFVRFAGDLYNYYFHAMADANLQPDDLDPDLRNLYSLMAAHAHLGVNGRRPKPVPPDAVASGAPSQEGGQNAKPSLLSRYPKGKTGGKMTIVRYEDDRQILVAIRSKGKDKVEVEVIPDEIPETDYEAMVKKVYDENRGPIDELVAKVNGHFQGWKISLTVEVKISQNGGVRISEKGTKQEGVKIRRDVRKALIKRVKNLLEEMPWPVSDYRSSSKMGLVVELGSQVPEKTAEATGS